MDDTQPRVLAKLASRPNPAGRAGVPLVRVGDELVAKAVLLDGRPLDVLSGIARADRLEIASVPQAPFVLDIETEINPVANTKLMGLFRSGSAFCTQCEAEGFRRITYFLSLIHI